MGINAHPCQFRCWRTKTGLYTWALKAPALPAAGIDGDGHKCPPLPVSVLTHQNWIILLGAKSARPACGRDWKGGLARSGVQRRNEPRKTANPGKPGFWAVSLRTVQKVARKKIQKKLNARQKKRLQEKCGNRRNI